jgi:hypothetical protein
MLAKCANPRCSVPFRYLESGELFRLEGDRTTSPVTGRREYFWLCRSCSHTMSLRLAEDAVVKVVQLRDFLPKLEDAIQIGLVDRQNGLVLNRIRFLKYRPLKRLAFSQGGQLSDEG